MGTGSTCTRACQGLQRTSIGQERQNFTQKLDESGIQGKQREELLLQFDERSKGIDKDAAKILKFLLLAVSFSIIVFWLYMIAGIFTPFLAMNDFQNRTHVMILARPVLRWEYLAGKYAAILALLVMNLVAMLAAFHLFMYFSVGEGGWEILKGVLIYLQGIAVFVSMMMLITILVGRIPSIFISLVVVGIGSIPGIFLITGKLKDLESQWAKIAVYALAYGLPQFTINFFYGLAEVLDMPGAGDFVNVLKQAGNRTGFYSLFINSGWLAFFWFLMIWRFNRAELDT